MTGLLVRGCAAAAAIVVSTGVSAAQTRTLHGEVVDVTSRWSADGRAIVSEVAVRELGGGMQTFYQLGGSVDGVGMIITHMPVVPRQGDVVTATVIEHTTRAGDAALAAQSVIMAQPLYVNTRTRQSGTPLHWESGCVFVEYQEGGTRFIAGDLEFQVADAVMQHWNEATASCSYLELRKEGTTDAGAKFDGKNVLLFRDDRWCRPPTDDEPEMCYNPSAAALTTLFFVDDPDSARDGAIFDADIEMNGVDFGVSVDGETASDEQCLSDLANTLTHEVGHLIGLDHTCWDGTGTSRPVDHDGEAVPSCTPQSLLSSEVTEASMFNFQACGETKKATVEPDDVAAVCGSYPIAEDPGTCEGVDIAGDSGCGCRAGEGAGGAGLLFAFAAFLGLRRRKRAPQRRRFGGAASAAGR